MLQTISKRFRFSASRRLVVPSWSDARNREHFGRETGARYGSGRNYGAVLVFRGEIDPATGMLVNVAEIKARMTDLIDERYDHRFLNADNPRFGDLVPTMENVARQLLDDAMPLFGDLGAELVACHLTESPDREATAYR
ncbi:6-pyruvoyl tetrahydropterin synthase, partial [bacterium]|nr:6-pyruvoyl tetrahydropterin synthase [bacterium]